jgi:hypothetical protein
MKCFLDMDGVLVDFAGGASLAHDLPNPYVPLTPRASGQWDMARLWHITDEQFWQPLNSTTFWESLQFTPEAMAILDVCESTFGQENVCLLSCPSDSAYSALGKLRWIQANLPRYARQYMLGPAKQFCAGPDAILIDDSDANCACFSHHCGGVVLVPRPWNANYDIADPVAFIRWTLDDIIKEVQA